MLPTKTQKAIAELNRIARAELGPPRTEPKRHRHDWSSRGQLKRGTTVTFYCMREGCDATKTKYFRTLEEEGNI